MSLLKLDQLGGAEKAISAVISCSWTHLGVQDKFLEAPSINFVANLKKQLFILSRHVYPKNLNRLLRI